MSKRKQTSGSFQRKRARDDASALVKGRAALAEAKSRKTRFDGSRIGRTLKTVSTRNGNVLAGGIAYYSLTSLTAAFVIAVSLSTYLVRFSEKWNSAFYSFLDDTVPGIIKSSEDPNGLIDPNQVQAQALTGIVGLVSLLILFNTATRYLSGLRVGTRAMLGTAAVTPVSGKLRDFIALFALIMLMMVGTILQLLASQFSSVVARLFSNDYLSEWIVRGPAVVAGVLVDMVFVALAILVLGRYVGPFRPLLWTLLAAGVAIGILRQAMSWVVASASGNTVLGSVTAVITLMFFVFYIARIILYAAAWLGTLPPSAHDLRVLAVADMASNPRRPHGTITTARAKRLRATPRRY